MARTQAKKAAQKAARAGRRSPDQNRKTNEQFGAISQHVRVRPGKRELLAKEKRKERIAYDDAPFIVLRPA